VLRTHPITIIGDRVHNSLFYEPADLLVGTGDVERSRAELMVERLRALTRRATAMLDFCRLLRLGASPDDLMRGAPALIAAELQLDYVQLFALLPSGDAVRLVGSSGLDPAEIGSVERLDPDTLMADTALRAGPVVIYDWRDETRLELPAVLRDAGVTSCVGIVLSLGHGERVYGFLSAHSSEPRMFSDDELLFLETIGHLLAYAFATARTVVSFRVLVENAPDLIIRFGEDLRVLYANPAIERMTGSAAESLIGGNSADLGIVEALVPTWELLLGQVWRTGREQAFELTVRIPTGERVFDSRIVPELGPDGVVESVLTISRDVTEHRRAEADRAALSEQLLVQQNRMRELMRDRERTLEGATAALHEHLNPRERHVLRLLAAGWTNRQIGAEIGLTTGTIKNQVAVILSKLNVTDRTQAAVRAVQLGLIDDTEH
jgi:PAS domain S-box-containing protein